MTPEFERRWKERINSDAWRLTKRRLIQKRGDYCEICGVHCFNLVMHHLTYSRLGYELDSDLQLTCRGCHPKADEERARKGQLRRRMARICGWAEKKYGPCWEDIVEWSVLENEFDLWLERKGLD